MINPSPANGRTQGYDSAMYRWYGPDYNANMNVAFGVSPQAPLTVDNNSSLVSTIGIDALEPQGTQTAKNCLRVAAVLTVLAQAPAPDSFRPPYCGSDKSIRFNKSQLAYTQFANLAPVTGTPSLQTITATFQKPWLDHSPGWQGEEYSHPMENLPNYGREISVAVGRGALMLNLNFPNIQKEPLLINMVQAGIDLYGVLLDGGQNNWPGYGGMESGRFFLILLAGLVLQNNDMLSVATNTLPNGGTYHFGELDQTFYVRETSPGVYNYGYGGYTAQDVGLPDWSERHWWQPQYDIKDWNANGYRRCCSATSWVGFILASHIMGIKPLWYHDAIFDYQDRYMSIEPHGSYTRCWNRPFTENMWDTYRGSYP